MTMFKTILIVLVLVSIVPAVFADKDKDKMSSEEWNDKDYKETMEKQDKENNDDDLTKHDVDVLCDATEDYEENKEQCDKLYDKVQDATLDFASDDKHDHDENDLKDNENEDPCYYEGFRIDNDHSFCD